ncbi:MAG: sulfite exporter TauE/SafE family protein [Alphaproteobacteria bacterium]|nr:sulfite exporter TauE/SafE family protein [Alphaproteobacteria bacterium]
MSEILGLLDWSLGEAIYVVGVVFAAAWIRGFSGFGFSAVVMAGLVLVLDPTVVVPLTLALEVLASIHMAKDAIRHIDFRKIGGLCLGAAVGTPIGVALLNYLPEFELKLVLYGIVLLIAITLLSTAKIVINSSFGKTIIAGIVSGILNGLAAIGGLPVVLYLLITKTKTAVMRSILVGYLFLADSGALFIATMSGLFTMATVVQVFILLPVLIAGVFLGGRKFHNTNPENFRNFVLCLLIFISLVGLAKTFTNA